MIPIVSIVGKSDSGKTTLVEKLIKEFTHRGYGVASVKHDVHDFEIDREGKDSWRHKKAGATTTIISSPHKVAVVSDTQRDLRLAELRERFITTEDLILSEGYYQDRHPKIEVSQNDNPEELLAINDPSLIAVVSKSPMELSVPWFNLNDTKGIADFIETTFLTTSSPHTAESHAEDLSSDGAPHTITGVILAGGKSIRMGRNKALVEIHGQRIIDRTVALFQRMFGQVILVTNEPLAYAYLDAEIVVDLIPNRGSLIGIYTGLFYSSYPRSFVAACDMPLLNSKVIEYMIRVIPHYDVVIPHLNDGFHPLHALYSKRCMRFIEKITNEDNLKITSFFNTVKVREVTPEEIIPLDPPLSSFFNINTPEDLERLPGLR